MYLKWSITKACNLNCRFCINESSRKKWSNTISGDELADFVDRINSSSSVEGITISGGEPLIAAEMKYFSEKIRKPWGLITSGAKISGDLLDCCLRSSCLAFVTVSIDCLNPEIVAKLRGSDVLGNQIETLNRILQYRKANSAEFRIYVNTVLNSVNADYVSALLTRLMELGVDRMQVLDYLVDSSGDRELIIPTKDKLRMACELSAVYHENIGLGHSGMELRLMFLPMICREYLKDICGFEVPIHKSICSALRRTVHLDPEGKIRQCKLFNQIEGYDNYRRNKLNYVDLDAMDRDVLSDAQNLILSSKPQISYHPCDECKHFFVSCVPCPLWCGNAACNDKPNVVISDCAEALEIMRA